MTNSQWLIIGLIVLIMLAAFVSGNLSSTANLSKAKALLVSVFNYSGNTLISRKPSKRT